MDQLARIIYMESLLDRCLESLHAENFSSELLQAIQELSAYYTSPLWLQDLDADRAGNLPPDLKRGVLSEDAVYNLLIDWDNLHQNPDT